MESRDESDGMVIPRGYFLKNRLMSKYCLSSREFLYLLYSGL